MHATDLGVAPHLNRLMGGWRDIVEDTRLLRKIAEDLPDTCDCQPGGGRCRCCTTLSHPFPEQCRTCTAHARALSPRVATVLDDTLRYLPAVQSVVPRDTVALQRSLGEVARAMIQLLQVVDTMQSATGKFRHGCRPEHIIGLKRQVGRLADAVESAHRLLRAL